MCRYGNAVPSHASHKEQIMLVLQSSECVSEAFIHFLQTWHCICSRAAHLLQRSGNTIAGIFAGILVQSILVHFEGCTRSTVDILAACT